MEQGTSWFGMNTNKLSIFRTEAFQFASAGNTVYVECMVRICLLSDASPECSINCPNRMMYRRDVIGELTVGKSQTATVKSPIFYVIDKGLELYFPFLLTIS